ncbi:DIS3-like exonuclease 1 [Chlorella sorokiniana]|uniref:DIS3-like exonuclease 1 n=1 Tax=Chlorella sorokiniana TaxID=3076 RepID=A0A2P6TUK7_CHLSO|nr:DIS3-like exonuclease 1 [Chlorella sorokiniana]|eukprot:PRW57734.1 DIS3-like exonuclease 1 [Chlorella sorokiniana]
MVRTSRQGPELPPAGWLERRVHHTFRFRKRSRTVADTGEEAYLRVDIPCGCGTVCAACPPTLPALTLASIGGGSCSSAESGPRQAHLLLPDAAALRDCLEVLELPEVQNVVLLTSEVRQLADGGGMRRSARLRALFSDRRRHNVLFDNLHNRETAPAAGAAAAERRAGLALLTAAEWYHEHLGRRFPIVVVSDALAAQFGVPSAAPGSAQQAPQQQQAAGQQAAAEADDAELEALLHQMDMSSIAGSGASGGSGTVMDGTAGGWGGGGGGGGASSGAAAQDDAIAGLLDSLGIGDEPVAGAAQQAQQALQAQQAQQAQQQAQPLPVAASYAPLDLEPGVHILSTAAYWGGVWGHVPAVADVFDSVQQSKAQEAHQGGGSGSGGGGFRPHLSHAAMEAGLASGALLAGTLSVSRRVPGEAIVAVGGGRQLLISGRPALNRAIHGDRVAIRLLPQEQWRHAAELAAPAAGDGEAAVAADGAAEAADGEDEPRDAVARMLAAAAADELQPTAEVVGILQRWSGEIVACISEDDERALASKQASDRQESVLCIPTDRRLPKLRLRSRQLHRLLGQRLVLRLDGWDQGSHYPHGHLVRVLGPINSLRSETDGVLVSSGVHWQPFSEGALRELPPVASSAQYVIPPAELAARCDLRGPDYLVCSIDPPGCTDVDDALSVRWLDHTSGSSGGSGGGGSSTGRQLVEVGVHIADVSYFVRQGGLLDSEAAARCTTVYLVDRRLDMLPALLSEDLCSLRGGQDRYAVSVLWTLDADTFEVQDVWFGRTLIRSRYQLEYSQAQDILDGHPPKPGHEVAAADRPALQRNLELLAALAEHRRRLRIEAGAVELESAELRFNTDAVGQPTTVTVKQEIAMMKIVAEMMILANAAVGQRIYTAFPRAALLRRHPPPRREAFTEVAALCESLGRPLDLEGSPAALAASLAAAAAAAPPAVASLIKSLATRAMSEAEYFCTGDVTGLRGGGGLSHFGLALPFYTHFTSPIRRYADVVVHRQLLAAVAAGPGLAEAAAGLLQLAALPAPQPPLPGADVSSKAAVMNERHRTAKRAQKDCSDLYLLLLLHAQPHVEAATVYGLRRQSLLVFLPKYHLKGVIHLTDKQGVCRPPLEQGAEDDAADPFELAHRRGLAVVAEGLEGSAEGQQPSQLAIVEASSGRQLASIRPMQRMWVRLSADGSRVHGPALRMRLLADSHPEAQAAAQKEAADAAAAGASGAAQATAAGAAAAGCGALPRPGAARPAYRPPGIGAAAGARAARLELRAAAGAPGRARTEACGAAASALSEQIEALQQAVLG